jgi:hypothetical protein
MSNRWLLEHDNEGEFYTRPRTNQVLIREALRSFDGRMTFYCCLFDTTDESCLWCVGEPDRRVIEGRLFEDDTIFHFVLSRRTGPAGEAVKVKCGMQPSDLVKVEPSEVLTLAEAAAVFLKFFRNKTIPREFEAVPKAYLFGSQSFKD